MIVSITALPMVLIGVMPIVLAWVITSMFILLAVRLFAMLIVPVVIMTTLTLPPTTSITIIVIHLVLSLVPPLALEGGALPIFTTLMNQVVITALTIQSVLERNNPIRLWLQYIYDHSLHWLSRYCLCLLR